MRDLGKTNRPLVRLLSTLVTVAMMWLPATALADDGGSGPTTTVLPLLGSSLTIEIVTDGAGVVTSVSVDGQVVDFEQEDDEVSFLFGVDGQTITITVEFEDDDDDADDESDNESDADDDADDDESDEDDDADDDESDEDDDESDDEDEGDA